MITNIAQDVNAFNMKLNNTISTTKFNHKMDILEWQEFLLNTVTCFEKVKLQVFPVVIM